MSYLHRLAHRIARTRTTVAALLAATAACSQGDRADFLSPFPNPNKSVLKKIRVEPKIAAAPVGTQVQFTASGLSESGEPVPATFVWTAEGGNITPSGLYTGGVAGPFKIIVSALQNPEFVDTAVIAVWQSTTDPIGLRVQPDSVTIEEGDTLGFSAALSLANGTQAAGATVSWSADGGDINNGGRFTSRSSGTYAVVATTQNGLKGTATVFVRRRKARLTSVSVDPRSTRLSPGQGTGFTATCTWSDGRSGSGDVSWTASSGTINSNGDFTAGPMEGNVIVVARAVGSDLADTARVSVASDAPILVSLSVKPQPVSIPAGASLQFSASGTWSNGSTSTPLVTWSATGGSITSAGYYTAGASVGTYRVVAVHEGGTKGDTAVVTISPPPPPTLTALGIAPESFALNPGASQRLDVSATWSDGTTSPPTVTWTATGGTITPTSAAGGSVTSGGLYTAGSTPGTYRVIAAGAGKADTAVVTVANPAAVLQSLTLSPNPVSMATAGTKQFSVTAQWSDGSTAVPALTWSATGGSITSTGLYSAGSNPGTYRVIASGGGKADTAAVTLVAAVVTSFVLIPATATLATGGTQQFQSVTTWSDGVSRPVSVTYSATGGSVSVGGLFTAGQLAGTFAVIASCGCGKADTSAVTVTGPAPAAPTLNSLSIAPAVTSLVPGENQHYLPSAVWSNGGTTVPQITWSATGGAISSGGLYAAGSAPGTYWVIASGGGRADTASVTIVDSTGTPVLPPPSSGCPNPQPGWIWCDDFEQDRLTSYFEYDNDGGDFARIAGVGTSGSTGMRVRWQPGEVSAGGLKLAFGHTPMSYMRPVDAGTANHRDIYWRMSVKHQAGWVGGGADKLSRAASFAGSNWSEAMIAHVWSGGTGGNYLILDPASGTDAAGTLKTTRYNDFPNLRWLGEAQGQTPLFDAVQVGQWYCVEAHALLNTAGQSNGLFELWINGALEARETGLNWVGSYNTYGINAIFFENYWNAGSPGAQERYFDDIVVSTQRIGCAESTPSSPTSVLTQLVLNPSSATLSTGGTRQFSVAALWSDGSTTLPAISWSVTGGTLTAGLYTAGSTPGTYRIIASGGGLADTSFVTVSTPVVTSFAISPQTTTLAVGGTQQFQAYATWSDGQSRSVSVSYGATGGTMSLGGLYVAGQLLGTFSVIANCNCGKADTAKVQVAASVPSTASPVLVEDFSTYGSTSNLFSDPREVFGAPPTEPSQIALDQAVGLNAGGYSLTKSLRFDLLATGACDEGTVNVTYRIPGVDFGLYLQEAGQNIKELWWEIWIKYASGFSLQRAVGCAPTVDQKTVLTAWNTEDWGRTDLHIKPDQGGGDITASMADSYLYGPDYVGPASLMADGNWHRLRVYHRVGTGDQPNNRVVGNTMRVWVDDALLYNQTSLTMKKYGSNTWLVPGFRAVRLGNNYGTPRTDQQMWWGRVAIWTSNPGW